MSLPDLARAVGEDAAYSHTTNLVAVRGGATVLSRHYGDGELDDLVDTYSMTKSVVATLAGIAIDRGALDLTDVRDLLTMTRGCETGAAWDIDAVMEIPSGWVDRILSAPRRHEPGTVFAYDNGAAHVLGAMLADAVGEPLADFARERLFRPARDRRRRLAARS